MRPSGWGDEMPKIEDADERYVALHRYEANKESLNQSRAMMAEYGKWLVATIAALHFGGLYLVTNAPGIPIVEKMSACWAFVIGIVLILLSGLYAFINWGTHTQVYYLARNPQMLVDSDFQPQRNPKLEAAIAETYRISLGLGLASVACLPIAMIILTCAV